MEWIQKLDTQITLWINAHGHNSFTDFLFPKITLLGNLGSVWILIILLLLCFKKTRRLGIVTAISLSVTFLLSEMVIKGLFPRVRPCNALPELTMLVEKLSSSSFPSSHAATSFACAVTFFCRRKDIGIPALVLALLISFSRIFLMLHYASDVLAGALFGSLVAIVFYFIFKRKGFFSASSKNNLGKL